MWRSNAYFRRLLGWHSGRSFAGRRLCRLIFLFCVSSLVFPQPLVNQEFESLFVLRCERRLSRLLEVEKAGLLEQVQRPALSEYNILEESTLSLVWSL